jgi:hypothetical protein
MNYSVTGQENINLITRRSSSLYVAFATKRSEVGTGQQENEPLSRSSQLNGSLI